MLERKLKENGNACPSCFNFGDEMGISQDKKVTNDKLFRKRSKKFWFLDYFVPLSFRVEQYKLVLKKKKKIQNSNRLPSSPTQITNLFIFFRGNFWRVRWRRRRSKTMASLMEFFPALIDFPVILSILCICFYTLVFFTKLLLMFFLGFAGAFIRSILIMSRFSQNSFVGFEILDMLFSLLYLFFFFP